MRAPLDARLERRKTHRKRNAQATVFHDATPGTTATMPPLRPKPTSLRVVVSARHSPAQVQALVAAVVSAAAAAA